MSVEHHQRGSYVISTDPDRLDPRAIHAYLTTSYWAEGISLGLVERSLRPGHRKRGLGRWLMECVMASPRLQGLRRWMLVTRDAHGLYEPLGFGPAANPAGIMEILRQGLYRAGNPA